MTIPKALESTWKLVGGLSRPGKMPCYGYGLPAQKCNIGSTLRNVEGSVCNKCYAYRGNYRFTHVKSSSAIRYSSLYHVDWVDNMTLLIKSLESSGYFRWHDSGDIDSLTHLENIVSVAKNLPQIKFWLPTREYAIVGEYVKIHGKFPSNLIVRLSAYMINGVLPLKLAKQYKVSVSGVSSENYNCPASSQGNKCLTCRTCWDKKSVVIYKKH
jgi:hypothetical protein